MVVTLGHHQQILNVTIEGFVQMPQMLHKRLDTLTGPEMVGRLVVASAVARIFEDSLLTYSGRVRRKFQLGLEREDVILGEQRRSPHHVRGLVAG